MNNTAIVSIFALIFMIIGILLLAAWQQQEYWKDHPCEMPVNFMSARQIEECNVELKINLN